MPVTNNAIIIATEKIVDMGSDEKRKLLLTLLGTNPATVLRAMGVDTKAASPNQLYKVAITDLNGENRKINVIRCVREITGYGLADSKAWSEGQNMGEGFPSGVFGHHMTLDAAKQLLEKVRATFRNSGNLLPKVEILTDGYFVKPLPNTWSNF
jgi:ribosomal protein L7/L12